MFKNSLSQWCVRGAALVSLSLAVVLPTTALAGDAERGKQEAQVCASCHNENGVSSNGQYPNIGGQSKTYLITALKQYREGAAPSDTNAKGGIATKKLSRKNAIMAGFAATLTDQQIADLAAWYSSQDGALYTPTNWND